MYIQHFCNGVQHAVAITDQRVYYIRYRPWCPCLLRLGPGLRVDCYRHNRDITYGRVESTYIPIWYRMFGGAKWVPGWVTMQCAYGVLKLRRRQGNVFNLFSAISQLSSDLEMEFLKEDDNKSDDRWDYAESQKQAEKGIIRRRLGVRQFKPQFGDMVEQGPPIYLVVRKKEDGEIEELEKPIFHWAFSHLGLISSKYNDNYDVLVTSGRCFIWTRSYVKHFDNKVGFCWCFLWCGCISAFTSATSAPNGISFFNLSKMLSFSSNVVVEPSVWVDPTHTPLNFPLYETLCAKCTKFWTCKFWDILVPETDDDWTERFSPVPTRQKPRIQLWLTWKLKTCFLQQPDLMASARPFQQNGLENQNLRALLRAVESLLGGSEVKVESEHVKSHDRLRVIMSVAQEVDGKISREIIKDQQERALDTSSSDEDVKSDLMEFSTQMKQAGSTAASSQDTKKSK